MGMTLLGFSERGAQAMRYRKIKGPLAGCGPARREAGELQQVSAGLCSGPVYRPCGPLGHTY